MNIIIGTRGSALALAQAQIVEERIKVFDKNINIQKKIIKTKGDILLKKNLDSVVEKGFFVNEIQQELIRNKIDISVHSLKDLPTKKEKNISISSILKRENPRDVFISKDNLNPYQMPNGSVIATSSNRRKYQLLKINSTFNIIEIRGNVDTRVKKLKSGYCDALVLAYAGIKRLNMTNSISHIFNFEEMLPAAGQGAIAIETRSNDDVIMQIVKNINCAITHKCVSIERKILAKLGLGCNAPIAINVTIEDNIVKLKLMIFSIFHMKDINIYLEKDVSEINTLVNETLSKLNTMDYKKILNE